MSSRSLGPFARNGRSRRREAPEGEIVAAVTLTSWILFRLYLTITAYGRLGVDGLP